MSAAGFQFLDDLLADIIEFVGAFLQGGSVQERKIDGEVVEVVEDFRAAPGYVVYIGRNVFRNESDGGRPRFLEAVGESLKDVRLGNAALDALAESLADVRESLVEIDQRFVFRRLLEALLHRRFACGLQPFRRQVGEERLETDDEVVGFFGMGVLVRHDAAKEVGRDVLAFLKALYGL